MNTQKAMEVKEAIEWIKNEINYNYNGQNEELRNRLYLFNCGMEDIISLLQQGEKYRQMWEEATDNLPDKVYKACEYYIKRHGLFDYPKTFELCVLFLKSIEQKYFPKEERK